VTGNQTWTDKRQKVLLTFLVANPELGDLLGRVEVRHVYAAYLAEFAVILHALRAYKKQHGEDPDDPRLFALTLEDSIQHFDCRDESIVIDRIHGWAQEIFDEPWEAYREKEEIGTELARGFLSDFHVKKKQQEIAESSLTLEQTRERLLLLTAEIDNLAPDVGDEGPVIMRKLEGVESERLEWLWPERIPLGKLSLLVGDPGLGKSLIALDVAAHLSIGRAWPDAPSDCRGFPPANTLLLTAEDDLADTVKPRLDAAKGDATRVTVLEAAQDRQEDGTRKRRGINLARDLARIEYALDEIPNVQLLVFDPLSAYLGGVDTHTNADVRVVLAPLADLASRRELAVLGVTHLRKSGGKALYRTMGSIAFAAAARAVWGVAADPDDDTGQRRIMLPIKTNRAPGGDGLAYRIIRAPLDGLGDLPAIFWEPEPVPPNSPLKKGC